MLMETCIDVKVLPISICMCLTTFAPVLDSAGSAFLTQVREGLVCAVMYMVQRGCLARIAIFA